MTAEAANARPAGLDRWRLTDAMKAAQVLNVELLAVGLYDEAAGVMRLRRRLRAMSEGLSVVDPNGRLVEPHAS